MRKSPRSAGGVSFFSREKRKLPTIGIAEKTEFRFPEETSKNGWRIPGDIDVPMLDPIIIPPGYFQSFSVEKNRWYLSWDRRS